MIIQNQWKTVIENGKKKIIPLTIKESNIDNKN